MNGVRHSSVKGFVGGGGMGGIECTVVCFTFFFCLFCFLYLGFNLLNISKTAALFCVGVVFFRTYRGLLSAALTDVRLDL